MRRIASLSSGAVASTMLGLVVAFYLFAIVDCLLRGEWLAAGIALLTAAWLAWLAVEVSSMRRHAVRNTDER